MAGNAAHPGGARAARADLRARRPRKLEVPPERAGAPRPPRLRATTTRTRRCRFAEAVRAGRGEARRAGVPRLLHAAQARRQVQGRRASARRPRYSYSACVVEVDGGPRDRRWSRVDKVWIAHDVGRALNPLLVEGQVEGSRLHGPRRGADGGAGLPQGRCHKIPSMLEYKSPTTLETPEIDTILVETRRSRGPVRRQGGRPGAAAAGDPGGRQRGLRRGRRAHRRGADHAREGAEGARPQAPGQAGALRAGARCRVVHVPGAADVESAVRAAGEAAREAVATPTARQRREGEPRHDAAAAVPLPRAARRWRDAVALLAEHGPDAMLVAGGTDLYPNMKRRQFEPTVLVGLRARRGSWRGVRRRARRARASARRRR